MGFNEYETKASANFDEYVKSRKVDKPEQPEQHPDPTPESTEIESSALSEKVNQKTAQSIQKLSEVSERAALSAVQVGVAEGKLQADRIRAGQHLGLLSALAQHRLEDAIALKAQIKALGVHTDNSAGDMPELESALDEVESNSDPLESLVLEGHYQPSQNSLKLLPG